MKTPASLLLDAAQTAPGPLRPLRWRWAVPLTLALAASVTQAQTLVDTLQTVNISNTLDQHTTSTDQAALDRAKALQTTQAAAAPAAPATQTLPAGTDSKAVVAAPFTDDQSARLTKAKELLRQSQWEQARPLFEELIAQNYQQPEPHFGLALSLFSLGDLTGARFELGQFVALAPDRFEGPYNLGIIASRLKEYDEALKQFTAAAVLSAQADPAARRQVLDALAGEQGRRQDYASLSSTLAQEVSIDPSDPDLQFRLGQAVALSGNGAGALPLLYTALKNDGTRAGAALLIADIYAAQKLPDRAVRELDSAAGQNLSGSDRARLLVRKAELLNIQNMPNPAAEAAQEAVQSDSRSVSALSMLGTLLAGSGDLKGSLDAWKKAAQYDDKNAVIRLNLAAIELSLGQNADARSNAALSLKLADPNDGPTLSRASFVAGVSAYRLKDYPGAVSALSQSVARQPSADTSLWLGLSLYARKDYPGAVSALSDSVRLSSTATARLNLGAALLAAGRFAEAEPNLRSVVVEDPSNAAAWYQLGLSRKAQGKDAQAKTAFMSAAKLGYAAAKAELK